jgi:hypothetical protein
MDAFGVDKQNIDGCKKMSEYEWPNLKQFKYKYKYKVQAYLS